MLEFSKYLESIIHLAEYLILYYLFSQVFEQRFKSHYIGYFIVLMLVGVNFSAELTLGLVSIQSYGIKLVTTLLTLILLHKGKMIHIVLMYVVAFIVVMGADFAVVSATIAIFNVTSEMIIDDPYLRLGLSILSRSLTLGIGQLVLRRMKSISDFDQRKFFQLIVLLLINTAFIILTVDIYFQNKSAYSDGIGLMLGIMFGIIVLSYLVLKMTDDLIHYSVKEKNWQLQEAEYQRQFFYMSNLEELNNQMRSLRHDFNNHIGCINGMLEFGDFDGAMEYASDLVSHTDRFNVVFSTNHTAISGLLNSKYQIMLDKKIEFVWMIDIPDKMMQSAIDISIILGNALDNAIEATAFVDEEVRYINLKMYSKLENLIIKVENSFDDRRMREDHSTTKLDKVNHGYGLKNIKFVVNKYDGIMKIETNSDEFILNIALPMAK